MKLPEFTNLHLAVFHVPNEYDFKSHNFQEFTNFINSSSFVDLSQDRRMNKRYCHLKKEEKVTACLVRTAFYIMCLKRIGCIFQIVNDEPLADEEGMGEGVCTLNCS